MLLSKYKLLYTLCMVSVYHIISINVYVITACNNADYTMHLYYTILRVCYILSCVYCYCYILLCIDKCRNIVCICIHR